MSIFSMDIFVHLHGNRQESFVIHGNINKFNFFLSIFTRTIVSEWRNYFAMWNLSKKILVKFSEYTKRVFRIVEQINRFFVIKQYENSGNVRWRIQSLSKTLCLNNLNCLNLKISVLEIIKIFSAPVNHCQCEHFNEFIYCWNGDKRHMWNTSYL